MTAYPSILMSDDAERAFVVNPTITRFMRKMGVMLLIAATFFVSQRAIATCQSDCDANAAIDDAAAGAVYGVAVVACIGTGPAYLLCVGAASITLGIAIAAIEAHRQVCRNGCPKE